MPYLIDGHNLIGQLPDIRLDDPHDEAKLVQKLTGFAARTGKRCIVIFDSGLPGGRSRMSTSTVQVIFATGKKTADDLMLARIKSAHNPREWIVVSSDNSVLDTAKAHSMEVLRSAEFAALLNPKPKPKVEDMGEAEDVYVPPEEVEEWLRIFREARKKRKK